MDRSDRKHPVSSRLGCHSVLSQRQSWLHCLIWSRRMSQHVHIFIVLCDAGSQSNKSLAQTPDAHASQEFWRLLGGSPKCKSSCLLWTWKPPWSLAWEGAEKETATDWSCSESKVKDCSWKKNKKQDGCVLGALQLKVKVCAEAKALTKTWCGRQNQSLIFRRAARHRALQNNCCQC